ncbi:hypothetical protein [Dyella sp.]|uniref:hypothetical protein n=1 Tax=Dyella sp. TaxID=1869338 RepID=UPI002D78B981|nr:hypothetical protein [Dyella sp.]HET7330924.1 hypothetical protein [Dyella sp.]
MKLDIKELRCLSLLVKKQLDEGTAKLRQLDEDSDEHMELANDLMLLDVLKSKLAEEQLKLGGNS